MYGYHANSPLVSTISHRYAGNNRMVTTKQYDLINRLTSIANGAFDSYAYGYNNANQRTNVVRADGRKGPQVDGMPGWWRCGSPARPSSGTTRRCASPTTTPRMPTCG